MKMTANKIVFGRWETTTLLINAMTVQVYLGFPRIMAMIGGTAAWMVVVLIFLVALLLFLIISKLFSKFEGKDLLDMAEHVAGGFGKAVTGLIIVAVVIALISLILREFAEDMKIISLPISPISFVMMFFLAGMVVSAYMGLEAIVRFHAIAVPVIIAGFLIIVIGVAPYFDTTNLLPILGNGPQNILSKGILRLSSFSSLIGLFMFFPFIKKNSIFKSSGLLAITVSSIIMLLSVLSYTLVFPYPTSEDNLLPVFQLARLINYGRFFQRIESVFVFIWATSALLYLSFGFFLAIYTFKKTFELKYYRPLILPFAVIVFGISILPQNMINTIDLESNYIRTYAMIVTFGLTLIILILASIIKKGRVRKEQKDEKDN
jgi:spore germination protein (amino acid permease)